MRRNANMPQSNPPVLQHPVPQHPVQPQYFAHSPPPPSEQASAKKASNQDYQRFSSPSVPAGPPQQQQYYQQQQQFNGPPQPQPQTSAYGQPNPNAPWASAAGQMWNAAQSGAGPDLTAQMGVQFGRSAVAAGTDYVEKNFMRHLPINHLRHSFNVSNLYVLKKLQMVLFPWRHKPWSRLVKRSETSGQAEGYRPPREDVNSPDLYIPTMALVTYILLAGVVAGSQSRFDPELLGRAASRALAIVFLEFLTIKMGTYFLSIGGEGTVVDLVAYSGYKFVGIIVTLVGGLMGLRGWMYWTTFIYVFLGNFFFLLRSLRYVVLPDPAINNAFNPTSTAAVTHSQRSNRLKFLFGIATIQSLSMCYLVYGA